MTAKVLRCRAFRQTVMGSAYSVSYVKTRHVLHSVGCLYCVSSALQSWHWQRFNTFSCYICHSKTNSAHWHLAICRVQDNCASWQSTAACYSAWQLVVLPFPPSLLPLSAVHTERHNSRTRSLDVYVGPGPVFCMFVTAMLIRGAVLPSTSLHWHCTRWACDQKLSTLFCMSSSMPCCISYHRNWVSMCWKCPKHETAGTAAYAATARRLQCTKHSMCIQPNWLDLTRRWHVSAGHDPQAISVGTPSSAPVN